MGSAREGTVEHRPSLLKCHYDCLFVLRKELKFILATHTDGRVWTRRGAPAYNQVGRGGAVRPSRPIAKSATVSSPRFEFPSRCFSTYRPTGTLHNYFNLALSSFSASGSRQLVFVAYYLVLSFLLIMYSSSGLSTDVFPNKTNINSLSCSMEYWDVPP